MYAKATPSFRAGAGLGMATLGLVALATLWTVGRCRWAFAAPERALGLGLFVSVGGYLIYDLWWMQSMYQVWWWDHVTHTVSAAFVAGIAYTAARARDHRGLPRADGGQPGPTRRVYLVSIGATLLAMGVWESYELLSPLVTVYGVEDTLKDVLFDLVGLAVVLRWGDRVLDGVASDVARRWGTDRS